jgi:argininosuccinate lyase
VLWANPRFGFVSVSDAFSTGSSIMPQKRNPDAAELIKGKAGRIVAALTGLLVVMKGLPLTYVRDMQEDKEPTFGAAEQLDICVRVMTGMLGDITVNKSAMRRATSEGFLTATDLADWLVQALDAPFRSAHHIAGRIVRLAEQKGVGLEQLSLADLKLIEPRITAAAQRALSVDSAIARRNSYGGTAPKQVRAALQRARRRLKARQGTHK